jgi:hypothetical protein
MTGQGRDDGSGLRLTGPVLTILVALGLPLLSFFVAFIGEVRINRQRVDDLERDVTALQAHDEESARDRRDLGTRLYRLEGVRIAPARGRE